VLLDISQTNQCADSQLADFSDVCMYLSTHGKDVWYDSQQLSALFLLQLHKHDSVTVNELTVRNNTVTDVRSP